VRTEATREGEGGMGMEGIGVVGLDSGKRKSCVGVKGDGRDEVRRESPADKRKEMSKVRKKSCSAADGDRRRVRERQSERNTD
jgi:hypothetical protein